MRTSFGVLNFCVFVALSLCCRAQQDGTRQDVILDSFAYKLPKTAAREPRQLLLAAQYLHKQYDEEPRARYIALNLEGLYLSSLGRGDSALELHTRAAAGIKSAGDQQYLAHTYNYLGIIFFRSGAYKEAARYFDESIKLFASVGRTDEAFSAYNNRAGIYIATGNAHRARQLMIELLTQKGLSEGQRGTALLNIANSYSQKPGYVDSVQWYGRQALAAFALADEPRSVGNVHRLFANNYLVENQPDGALRHFSAADSVYNNIQVRTFQNEIVLGKLEAFLLKKQMDSAGRYLKTLEEMFGQASQLPVSEKSAFLRLKSQWLMQRGDATQAAVLLNELVNLKDSAYKARNFAQLLELETVYHTERKNAQIKELEERNQQQSYIQIMILLSAGTGLLALILLLLYIKEKARKRQLLIQQEQERQAMELERRKLQEQALTEELETAGRKLVNRTLSLSENNTFLTELLTMVNEAAADNSISEHQKWQRIKNQLTRKISGDEDWELFLVEFEKVNDRFFRELQSRHPDLTLNEKRLCALSRTRLSNKEMADLLHISPDSVKMARYRMKKKMNLPQEQDLDEYIGAI